MNTSKNIAKNNLYNALNQAIVKATNNLELDYEKNFSEDLENKLTKVLSSKKPFRFFDTLVSVVDGKTYLSITDTSFSRYEVICQKDITETKTVKAL